MPNKQVGDLCESAVGYEPIVNGTPFSQVSRGIYIGVAGNATVTDCAGNDVLFKGLAAGSVLPVRATQVKASNTTATDLVALF